ncbi:uncharacterized protein LOC135946900 isoform X2 [Cloeon dipterum]|uniref:uncharacterized protein LOC135946900 isoform X2 n=1 Tax=Cloeon dipterum TaxID=197152 RepID=UPI00321FEDB8
MLQKQANLEPKQSVPLKKMAKGVYSIRAELTRRIAAWSDADVVDFLQKNKLSDCCHAISSRGITGQSLLDSNDVSLSVLKKDIGMVKVRLLTQLIKDLKETPEKYVSADSCDCSTENTDTVSQNMDTRSRKPPMPPPSYSYEDEEEVVYMNNDKELDNAQGSSQQQQYDDDEGDDDDDNGSWASDDFDEEVEYGNVETHPQYEEGYLPMNPISPSMQPQLPMRAGAMDPNKGKRNFEPLPLPPDMTLTGNIPPPMDDEDCDYLDPVNDINPEGVRKLSLSKLSGSNSFVEPTLPPRPGKKNSLPNRPYESHNFQHFQPEEDDDQIDYEEPIGSPMQPNHTNRKLPLPPTNDVVKRLELNDESKDMMMPNGVKLIPLSNGLFGKQPRTLPLSKPIIMDDEKNVRTPSSSTSSPSISRSTKGQLNSPSQQRPLPELPSPVFKSQPKIAEGPNDAIEKARWFFQVDRKQANELLRECGFDGCFMIRNSSKEDAAFTLSVLHKTRLYHIQVRKRADDLYALGKAKKNEHAFPSVEGLVTFYGKEPLKLYTNGKPSGETLLKMAPRRVDK